MFQKIKNWLFQNQTTGQTIAKNTFWLFVGQMASRLTRAAIVIYAARFLGVASWGAFSYALGIVTFLTTLSDIGINALITKEATRNPQLKDEYLSTALFTKLGILAILSAATFFLLPHLTNMEEAALIMPILIFVFIFDSLRDLGSALSRAMEKMQIEAFIQIFTNSAIVVLGFIFLGMEPTSQSLSWAYAIGSALGLISIFIALRHHLKNILTHFNKKLVGEILLTAWPFGLMGLLGVVNLNTDIIMLGWLRSPEEVGYYSAAQKIIYLIYSLPGVLASGIFPALAKLAVNDNEQAKRLLGKATSLVIAAAVPMAILGIFLARPIIYLLFGTEYLPAVATFQILMSTLILVFPSTVLGNALFAYDQRKAFIWLVAASTVSNVLLNFALIPYWGIEGAAIATLISQFITNFFIWRKVKILSGFRLNFRGLVTTP